MRPFNFSPLLWAQSSIKASIPSPPTPELIKVVELPLPPVVANESPGACAKDVNLHGTGCIGRHTGLFGGNFLPDSKHVVAAVTFAGAPAAPDPASIYSGQQLIIVKADGTTFTHGDAWKCITCGVPAENALGRNDDLRSYPQAFRDGKHILIGTNILSCSGFDFASDACVPDMVIIHPIRWQASDDTSGVGGPIRELRIHPDGIHLGFNAFDFSSGTISQHTYIGKLQFNPSPRYGLPMVPRYDVVSVSLLVDPTRASPISTKDGELHIHEEALTIGELRGFSGTGREVTYIGYPSESCNIDMFAADLITGQIRRLTSHPEYVDPVDISPDDEWTVIMDTRTSNRQMFMSGMRGVPPLIDLVATAVCASVRNNGHRRFFRPFLLDRWGDRDTYFGQQINAEGSGIAGSGDVNDPEWNGMADPKFSLDGTKIVYAQAQTVFPACGRDNPLPCYNSTAQGGRHERLMLAHLTSRKPLPIKPVAVLPDKIPWAGPHKPGMSLPSIEWPKAGNYVLKARTSGHAQVELVSEAQSPRLKTVAVTYHNFSDDGVNFLTGSENVTVRHPNLTSNVVDWSSDLKRVGDGCGVKQTSADGFLLTIDTMTNIFNATGTLTTIIDGIEYRQPLNGA